MIKHDPNPLKWVKPTMKQLRKYLKKKRYKDEKELIKREMIRVSEWNKHLPKAVTYYPNRTIKQNKHE